MATAEVHADDSRISAARAHAAQHRLDAAEAVYREILATAPDTPEALNFVAMCELGRGECAAAQQRLERAAHLNPEEPEIWKNLGIVHLAQGHGAEALDTFDRALGQEPMHFASRLHRGAALEQMGRVEDAVASYYGALGAAQSHGKWRNDVSTPPELRLIVRHAIAYVDRHRKEVFMARLEPLRQQYGAAALTRVEQGLEIYLDEREAEYPDPLQACRFFYVPGLSSSPWLEHDVLPWLPRLEAQIGVMAEEVRALLAQPIGVEPRFGTNDLEWLQEQKLLEGTTPKPEWNAFYFQQHGAPCAPNRQRCPRTAAILDAVPQLVIPGHAPHSLLALLAPGTHVMPRHGVTNARISVRLPLLAGDTLRAGTIERTPQAGRCDLLDESFEHEFWNHGDRTTVALVLDAWHPDLTAAERAAIALLFDAIGRFNQQARVDPPPVD